MKEETRMIASYLFEEIDNVNEGEDDLYNDWMQGLYYGRMKVLVDMMNSLEELKVTERYLIDYKFREFEEDNFKNYAELRKWFIDDKKELHHRKVEREEFGL